MKMNTRKFRKLCRETDGEIGATEGGLYECRYEGKGVSEGAIMFDPESETFALEGMVSVSGIPEDGIGFTKDTNGEFGPGLQVGTEELQDVYRSIRFTMGVPEP